MRYKTIKALLTLSLAATILTACGGGTTDSGNGDDGGTAPTQEQPQEGEDGGEEGGEDGG